MRRPSDILVVALFSAFFCPAIHAESLLDEPVSWAFQPPAEPDLPEVQDQGWARSPIDSFILHRLEGHDLRPAPPVEKQSLIRRATFDLIGLPPTPEEVESFLADDSPEAFAKLVERLLASPRYGERWGRRWLDVARYADSNGLDENLAYAHAFRYRDYVIGAFNKDKPFDRFLHEQVAGDLMQPAVDWDDPYEGIVATGLLSLGAKMLAEDDPVKMQMDIVDEQVDTVGRAFLGLTLGCARCHDHKYDPIGADDYYALAGIFKSTQTIDDFKVVARWHESELASPAEIRDRDRQQQQIEDQQTEIDRVIAAGTEEVLDEARQHVGHYLVAAWELERIDGRLARTRVYGNDSDDVRAAGGRLIEAENANRRNVTHDTQVFGKQIGVVVSGKESPSFVEYDIHVEVGGWYQLELRYAALASRPCKLAINGSVLKSDAAASRTGSWYPDSQTWSVEGIFALRAGHNVVRLEAGNPPQFLFPHIDKLLLVPIDVPRIPLPTDDYQPHAEIVRRWADWLQQSKSDPQSVIAEWHALVKNKGPAEVAGLLSGVLSEVVEQLQLQKAFQVVLADPEGPFAPFQPIEQYFAADTSAELKQLRDAKRAMEESLPEFPKAMAVADGVGEDLRIHISGSHLELGELVPRGFPRVLRENDPSASSTADLRLGEGSGRLELAHWLTRPNSIAAGLTARVMANRIWLGHFGAGLVRTPDNFGELGEVPTHPELLDWLAVQFVESGWSVKRMHQLIMLSSTYQMSTAFNEQAMEVDPKNRLCWRMNRRRLEAEAVRDAILAVAGTLDVTPVKTLLPHKNRDYVTVEANIDPAVYRSNRRSVYLPVIRSAVYDMFQAFDFADPGVLAGQRQSTTVPSQALFMMNSKLVAEQTRTMAERLVADEQLDDAARVGSLYNRALNRSPTGAERKRALRFVERYAQKVAQGPTNESDGLVEAWQSLSRAVISTNEFIFVD